MAKTIGNPLSWSAKRLGGASDHLAASAAMLGGEDRSDAPPVAQHLELSDLRAALRSGWDDFLACRTDAVFAVLIYPVVGLALIAFGFHLDHLPLVFPLMAGFALLGPVAAVGLYEMSRRREAGEPVQWRNALDVAGSPAFGAIIVLGLYLLALFAVWMIFAAAIYNRTLGPEAPASVGAFVNDILSTGAGWTMLIVGVGVGFVFALVALAISVVSFPLLLDRHVGVPVAVATSIAVTRANPVVILSWGAIVAAGLALGALPFLVGLIVVMPVLGHATWHLYRRAVA